MGGADRMGCDDTMDFADSTDSGCSKGCAHRMGCGDPMDSADSTGCGCADHMGCDDRMDFDDVFWLFVLGLLTQGKNMDRRRTTLNAASHIGSQPNRQTEAARP